MTKQERVNLFITSLILFVGSAIVAYIPFQLFYYGIAKLFGISTELEFFRVVFTEPNYSGRWTELAVFSIYGIPPLFSLLMAFTLIRKAYEKSKGRKSNYKLFLVWLIAHLYNLSFGGIVAGWSNTSEMGYILNWLYIHKVIQPLIALSGLVILFFLTPFLNRAFLQCAPSKKYIDKENQRLFKRQIIYLPFLVGSLFLTFVCFPHIDFHARILNITLIFLLLRTLKYYDEEDIRLVKSSLIFKPNYGVLLSVIAYLIFMLV